MDDPYPEVEIKPQLKPRGGVTKEDDPKPSHQLYNCRLNPHDQLGRLCVCGIYEHIESSHKRTHTSSDVVDTGGKNTEEEQEQIRI